ncbi:hypothetical protein J1605_018906 [Eschrichtius robustus]|uniref:Uncharacterized protein n=1 Tax=Eschrichtius robustus TaxID=9764 RepID=A0AB34HQJ3_ESCRO|nr:hypothetical protein J1605_018906 [Eschrichtius robustus]
MVTDEPMSCTKVEHSPLAKAHSLSSVHFLPGPLLPTPPPSSYSNISHHSSHTSGLSESPFRLIMPEAYVRCWHKVVQLNHTGLTSEISSGSGVMVQDTMGKFYGQSQKCAKVEGEWLVSLKAEDCYSSLPSICEMEAFRYPDVDHSLH